MKVIILWIVYRLSESDINTDLSFVKTIKTYPCLYLSKNDNSDRDQAWAEIGLKYNATSKFDLFDIFMQLMYYCYNF
jgi:hypothetical protein